MRHPTKLVVASLALAAGLAGSGAAGPAVASPGHTRAHVATAAPSGESGADEVRTWNAIAMNTLVTAKTPVPEQPLYLAYVQRAVDAAVRGHRHHRSGSHITPDVRAAVATAAWTVLRAHFAAQQTSLDQAYADSLSTIPDDAARVAGLVIGRRAAERLLARRADDGRNGPVVPVSLPAPGVWTPAPPAVTGLSSWLGTVRPFTLSAPDALRPPAPPALGGARYARAFAETSAFGSLTSSIRTPAQTEVARFWSDPPYVQNQRGLREWSVRQDLSTRATARLFALADTAAADALISCWDAKFHFQLWRPAAAVPGAGSDGNEATRADPGWVPLLATPPHPEYPSAHSCATTALAEVTEALSPTGRLDLDLVSAATGTTHHYATARDLVAEVANARVWGGLHWRFSTRAGERIGSAVAESVLEHRR